MIGCTDIDITPMMLNQMNKLVLTCKAPKTTIVEFANIVVPDETAHNDSDLQCLPSSL